MEVKTSELIGPPLNWAVAKCEHNNKRYKYGEPCFDPNTRRIYETQGLQQIGVCFSPITNWPQGGPIIEREKIKLSPNVGGTWSAQIRHEKNHPLVAHKVLAGWTNRAGPTPLIAAMRCYVAAKLGDVVEVPEELTQ